MKCVKCGKSYPDDVVFCPECGSRLEADSAADRPADNDFVTPAAETPATETPVTDNIFTGGPAVPAEPTVMKPGKKVPIALISVIVLLVAAVAAVICFYGPLSNFMKRTFMSSEKYYQSIELASVDKMVDDLTENYGKLVVDKVKSDDQNVTADFEIALGKKGKSLLDTASALTPADLTWIESLGFKMDANKKKDIAGVLAGVTLNGTEIAQVDAIVNLEDYVTYLGLPTFASKYIFLNLPEMSGDSVEEITAEFEELSGMIESILPTESEAKTLLKRYLSILVKNSNNVEKEKGYVIKADGVEQKVMELVVTYDVETIKATYAEMAETVKDDKELLAVLTRIADAAKSEGRDLNPQDGIDEIVESLTEAQNKINDIAEIKMSVYVDNKGNVVGRSVKVGPDSTAVVVEYLAARDGSDYGYSATVSVNGAVMAEFSASGTLSGEKLTGKYSLDMTGATLLTGDIEKFDLASAKEGYPNGYFNVKVGSGVLTAAGLAGADSSASTALSILQNYALGFDFDCSKNKAKVVISVEAGKDDLLTLTSTVSTGNAKSISLPKEKDVVAINDINGLQQYVGELNFKEFLGNLKKAGVPQEYVDMIESQLDKLDF